MDKMHRLNPLQVLDRTIERSRELVGHLEIQLAEGEVLLARSRSLAKAMTPADGVDRAQ